MESESKLVCMYVESDIQWKGSVPLRQSGIKYFNIFSLILKYSGKSKTIKIKI